MPKISPPLDPGTDSALDLNPNLADLTRTLRNHLTAKTTAQIYKDLAAPSDTSLPVLQGLGDALGGLAKGWQGMSEMQSTLQDRLMEQIGTHTGSPGGVEEMMKWMMLLRMFREMSQEDRPKKDEDQPSWRDLLAEQEKRHQEVREAEHSVPPSPIEQQMMGVMVQALGQNLQAQMAPRDPMDALRQAQAQVQELHSLVGTDPHASLHDRQWDLADKRLQYQHEETLQQIADRQKARREDYPAIAQQVIGGLAQLAGQLGFRTVDSGGPVLVSPEAMAAARMGQPA